MKNLKQTLYLILVVLIPFNFFGQDNQTVTITVSAQGSTISEAKQNALRDAIEQAFGTFISSNTEILNDELVKDEIVSVSNGNIKNYQVVNEVQLPNGSFAIALKATVSLTNLASFVESRGANIEFKGSLFAANMLQQELNEKAELKAVKNIIKTSKSILAEAFDYYIESSSNPIKSENEYKIPLTIKIKLNENFDIFRTYFNASMDQLSMSPDERNNYKTIGKPFDLLMSYNVDKKIPLTLVYFRNEASLVEVNNFVLSIQDLILGFEVKNEIKNFTGRDLIPTDPIKFNQADITIIDLFRVYVEYMSVNENPFINPIAGSLFARESWRPAINLKDVYSHQFNIENFIIKVPKIYVPGNPSLWGRYSTRFKLKSKYFKKIDTSNRIIILNFYNFYSDNFGINYSRNKSYFKTEIPEEFLDEKSIIWIKFYDIKTLEEIKQISEYTINSTK